MHYMATYTFKTLCNYTKTTIYGLAAITIEINDSY